jgi:hypothetical protein
MLEPKLSPPSWPGKFRDKNKCFHLWFLSIHLFIRRSPPDVKASVLDFLIDDIKARMDLAFSWLYEEYCFCQSFHRAQWNRRTDDTEYNELLCHLISGVLEKTEGVERDNLMTRLYLESPMITQDAIELLKKYVLVKCSIKRYEKLMF